MQIISYPAHYQSVYTNLDLSSFSLISCALKAYLLLLHTLSFTLLKVVFSQKIALSLLISQYFYRYVCKNIRYEKFRLPKKY